MTNDKLLTGKKNYKVLNGDFVIGESDYQNVNLMIDSEIGHFRQYPFLGFGGLNFVNRLFEFQHKAAIQKLLSDDGYNVKLILQDPNTGEIKIEYT